MYRLQESLKSKKIKRNIREAKRNNEVSITHCEKTSILKHVIDGSNYLNLSKHIKAKYH